MVSRPSAILADCLVAYAPIAFAKCGDAYDSYCTGGHGKAVSGIQRFTNGKITRE